jgi:predicted RNA-binding Zn-ribbon protein involved in translation (DUF1610 family)
MLRLLPSQPSITSTSFDCPQCGGATQIKLVEPHPTTPGQERRIFECRECGLPRAYVMVLH